MQQSKFDNQDLPTTIITVLSNGHLALLWEEFQCHTFVLFFYTKPMPFSLGLIRVHIQLLHCFELTKGNNDTL